MLGRRSVSELIAVLVIVAVAVVAVVVFTSLIGVVLEQSKPRVKHLDAFVTKVEVLHADSPITIDISSTASYTAYYVYRLHVVIHNVGSSPISDIHYRAIPLTDTLSICRSDSCDIYDPVALTENITNLPTHLGSDQSVEVSFLVASKVDLLSSEGSPFAIEIGGVAPDGSYVHTYVVFKP